MYQIKVGESQYELLPSKASSEEGVINDVPYTLDISGEGDDFHLIHNHKSYSITIVDADYEAKSFIIRVNSNEYILEAKDRFDLLLQELGMEDLAGSAINDLKAPMPGLVLKINVKAGDTVKKGDALLVLEAMKMENILKAESDAEVKAIRTEISNAVEKNQVLIEFEA